jgi:4-hydroxy-3-methylbut-2-enyl diphosphate reductase
VRCVGVTSGASAPEHLVQEVVAYLKWFGPAQVEERELVKEHVNFGLPLELIQLTQHPVKAVGSPAR